MRLRTCRFASLDDIADATVDQLEAIDGIGSVIAESVVDWFQLEYNQQLIQDLRSEGVNTERLPEEAPPSEEEATPAAGKTFVLTGSLPTLTRSEATSLISQAGGRVTSSVSGNTDYLVVGENPGSKYDEAAERDIPMLDEDQLRDLIDA